MGSERLAAAASRRVKPCLDWWPDWSNDTALLIASGPSAKEQPIERARGKVKTLAINESWRLAPWADALFGVDWEWWNYRKGVPEFPGLKIGQNLHGLGAKWDIRQITLSQKRCEILTDERGVLGRANSGFAAINLAVQFGAKKLILVGYDCSLEDDAHWHGRHEKPLRNPLPITVERWADRIDAQAERLKECGVQVFNCSPISRLRKYPIMTLEEALHACGALGPAHNDTEKNRKPRCCRSASRDVDSIRTIETPCICEASKRGREISSPAIHCAGADGISGAEVGGNRDSEPHGSDRLPHDNRNATDL